MNTNMARVLIAAPASGSGKTTVTCGLIAALKKRKLQIASVKCGPDYIDPMFHRRVLGISAGNLDSYFTERELLCGLLKRRAKTADVTVMEGVMGYYDGIGGTSDRASCYEIARWTKTPVVFVADGQKASLSIAATVCGFAKLRADANICGIILNRVTANRYEKLKAVIERESKIPVLGFVPPLSDMELPSRHLGLCAPEEISFFEAWTEKLSEVVGQSIDLEKLLSIAESAPVLSQGAEAGVKSLPVPVRIGVARDEAFSFYYEENMELLRRMGAELVYFSPLRDTCLPENICGVLLGGGYPELYAKQLSENTSMREAVARAVGGKMPCLAECGGFLYLQQTLVTKTNEEYPMCGVLAGRGYPTERLRRFGYMEAHAEKTGVLGENISLKGHEFHYWECTENGTDVTACRASDETDKYGCMVYTDTLAAGFPHFYYYSNPDAVYRFLENCAAYEKMTDGCPEQGRETERSRYDTVYAQAKARWDTIAKPIDSLGLLEDMVCKLCAIAGDVAPYKLDKRAVVVLCGDHGVVSEGVTQTGSEVTRVVAENFAKRCSSVNHMAAVARADVFAVDIGMNTPRYERTELMTDIVVDRKVGFGTANLAVEPAMTVEQCRKAIEVGMSLVRELKQQGYRIIATGEMGIGNTTPSSVLAALLLDLPAEAVTGRGAGLDDKGLEIKRRVIARAAERARTLKITDTTEILAQVGGYEIAGMAGLFLGGVREHVPILIDGAISAVSALVASRMDERVSRYAIASHVSQEITGRMALRAMGLPAVIDGRMCLGEGSGAVALLPLIDMGLAVYKNMATFADLKIDAYERSGKPLRENKN